MTDPSVQARKLAEKVRPTMADGCAYSCGCDDPGNPARCIHEDAFSALAELVALAERGAGEPTVTIQSDQKLVEAARQAENYLCHYAEMKQWPRLKEVADLLRDLARELLSALDALDAAREEADDSRFMFAAVLETVGGSVFVPQVTLTALDRLPGVERLDTPEGIRFSALVGVSVGQEDQQRPGQ